MLCYSIQWKYRLLLKTTNHLGGYTNTETELDFAGVPKLSKTYHKRLAGDTERIITETFEYDSQNRLLIHKHKVDNNPEEILAQNTYNDLSQLTNKKVGGTLAASPLQSIDYTFNIRGWMTKINDPKNLGSKLFGYEIKYNTVEGLETPNLDYTGLQVKPKYNGNIAEVDWRTATTTGDNLRRYGYVYDSLNRLQAGFYQKDSNPSAKEYFEKMDYDLNGNITNLQRSADSQQGAAAFNIDELTYAYANNNISNRLTSVTDSSTDYRGYPDVSGIAIPYDVNGNMTSHKDKGILGMAYNFLNLPDRITFDQTYLVRNVFSETTETRNITTSYLFRADGTKLNKIYMYGVGKNQSEAYKITEYLDGFQYEGQGSSLRIVRTLKFVPMAEGYYNFENNKYIYNYEDHLGNVRLSYFNNGSSIEVLEENNYYPFGMKHEGYNGSAGNSSYQYKYNGKELQTESGMYDYGARFYMPDIGRWGVVDSKGAEFPGWSPYNYSFNNPIRFIDPDGNAPSDIVFINNRGVEVHRIKSDTQFKTYIQATTNASSDPAKSTAGWKQVPMPNIIQNKGGEDVSGSAYQENDYQIAARTGYFNQVKNSGQLDLVTEGANPIPQDAIKGIPDLDPTLVKAITVQESNAGTSGITDIMQANVPGDWSKMKSEYGLTKGAKTDESTSLFAGTRILGTKGFKGGVSYDSKTGKTTYKFQGWAKAVEGYNGGGTAGYQKRVLQMQQESKKPKSSDY